MKEYPVRGLCTRWLRRAATAVFTALWAITALAAGNETGQFVQGTGQLYSVCICEPERSIVQHYLKWNGKTYVVELPSGTEDLNGQVTFQGSLNGESLSLTAVTASPGKKQWSPGGPPGVGPATVTNLVWFLRVTFEQPPPNIYPLPEVLQGLFDYADGFYITNSQGAARMQFRLYPQILQIPQPSSLPDLFDTAHAALSAATPEYQLTNGVRLVVYHPNLFNEGFAYGGVALLGGPYVAFNERISSQMLVHEVGHTFGLQHANSSTYAWKTPYDSNRETHYEYGDPFDPMGTKLAERFSARALSVLGWLNEKQIAYVPAGPQMLRLYGRASPGDNSRLLGAILGTPFTGEQLWVEFCPWAPGLVFRGASDPSLSYIAPTWLVPPDVPGRPDADKLLSTRLSEIAVDPVHQLMFQVQSVDSNKDFVELLVCNLEPKPAPQVDLSLFTRSTNGAVLMDVSQDLEIPVSVVSDGIRGIRTVQVFCNGRLYYQTDATDFLLPWRAPHAGNYNFQVTVIADDGFISTTTFALIAEDNLSWTVNDDIAPPVTNRPAQFYSNAFGQAVLTPTEAFWCSNNGAWQAVLSPGEVTYRFFWSKDSLFTWQDTTCWFSQDARNWTPHNFDALAGDTSWRFYPSGAAGAEGKYQVFGKTVFQKFELATGAWQPIQTFGTVYTSSDLKSWTRSDYTNITGILALGGPPSHFYMIAQGYNFLGYPRDAMLEVTGTNFGYRARPTTYQEPGFFSAEQGLVWATASGLCACADGGYAWRNLGNPLSFTVHSGQLTCLSPDGTLALSPPNAMTNSLTYIDDEGSVATFPGALVLKDETEGISILGQNQAWSVRILASALECWKSSNSLSDLAADDDHDGLSNLQEYIFGTDPQMPELSLGKPVIASDGVHWTFPLSRSAGMATVIFQTSDNLRDWQTVRTVTGQDFSQPTISVELLTPFATQGYLRCLAEPWP